ncbi:MAG: hypothetical protein JJU11_04780 [Candidatus Sumerlaeia bacterium]|nr:hypothetical protein [Candidatus Sumerlaeia bacterium]
MKGWFPIAILLLVAVGIPLQASDPSHVPLTNSRSPYVHIITLFDKDGRAINPARGHTTPFSMEATCARCHDVSEISSGFHFNANHIDQQPGRPGEPWILSDYQTGTQIPVSYRGWEGTWRPEDLGMTDNEFVRKFGRHLPGGGPGKPNPHVPSSAEGFNEVFEIDCMVCHTSPQGVYNFNDRRRFAEAGQFKSILVSGIGLGTAEYPEASAPADPLAAFDPALEDEEVDAIVKFIYNTDKFESDGRVFFPVTRAVSNDSCYQCHTSITHEPDMTNHGWKHDKDVHILAGMQCIDCHSHGIDHNMVRGFEGESDNPFMASLTCQGCHYGVETDEGLQFPGRKGAPIPGHEGIPPVHFEIMSCTACHSGPMPEDTTQFFQTSMAHSLGFPEFGRGNLTTPMINAPIFIRGHDGKIAPHKIMWPAFWGWKSGDNVEPILPDDVKSLTGRILSSRPRARDRAEPLDDEIILEALQALQRRAPENAVPVYIAAGTERKISGDEISVEFTDLVAPYTWALAHDVRPAGMALGARGCQECHAADSPFLTGVSTPSGPITGTVGAAQSMLSLMGLDQRLQSLWAMAFMGRPAFKVFAFAMAGIILIGAFMVTISLFRIVARRLQP